MPQPSLTGKFKWLEESDEFNVSSMPDDNEYVYILEVNLCKLMATTNHFCQ